MPARIHAPGAEPTGPQRAKLSRERLRAAGGKSVRVALTAADLADLEAIMEHTRCNDRSETIRYAIGSALERLQ